MGRYSNYRIHYVGGAPEKAAVCGQALCGTYIKSRHQIQDQPWRRVTCQRCLDKMAERNIVLPPVPMVTRRNLLSGVEYQESADTPSYCSPSSEAYWSM